MKNLGFLILIVTLASCKPAQKNESFLAGMEDFDKFYNRFHTDTAFQTLHITFPLEGLPSNAANLELPNGGFYWQKSNWDYHEKLKDPNFTIQYETIDDFVVTEFVRHKSEKIGMMRRFSKLDDDWYLIYYAALNPINK